MKHWKAFAGGLIALLAVTATFVPMRRQPARGVRLLGPPATTTAVGPFHPEQSAALFIGVRKFTHDKTVEVPFAADDAVDLAYKFALDRRVRLVPPERVVIALSGRPQKAESQARLKELIDAGAKVANAGPSDILALLQQQAATAGKEGMLIVSIATHGYVKDGVPYILGSTSIFQYLETALPMPKLFDIAARSEARRSVFFIDACRERISKTARAGATAATTAPLISRMGRVHGQVVLFAAAAGGYAYDGDGNGVFTKAVLEALDCKATRVRGAVTVETLHRYVERTVRTWIRQHRDPNNHAATQVSLDGDTRTMPLCECENPPRPPSPENPKSATYADSTVTAFSAEGTRLWSRNVAGPIGHVVVDDLDSDGSREVVVATNTLVVFDRRGARAWAIEDTMRLRTFLIDDLLRSEEGRQIVALWDDERASRSRVAMYSGKGQRLSTYEFTGRLQHITIDRPTSHHGSKIIVADSSRVMVLDSSLKPLWTGVLSSPSERITRLTVVDHNNDSRRDIVLTTASGRAVYVDFEGYPIDHSSPGLSLKIVPRKVFHPR